MATRRFFGRTHHPATRARAHSVSTFGVGTFGRLARSLRFARRATTTRTKPSSQLSGSGGLSDRQRPTKKETHTELEALCAWRRRGLPWQGRPRPLEYHYPPPDPRLARRQPHRLKTTDTIFSESRSFFSSFLSEKIFRGLSSVLTGRPPPPPPRQVPRRASRASPSSPSRRPRRCCRCRYSVLALSG